MSIAPSPFPLINHCSRRRLRAISIPRISIQAPPAGFDYKSQTSSDTATAVEGRNLVNLMGLVEEGTLVLVEKRRFGPVPSWRSPFVEPEEIWLVGTSHVSEKSAVDVDRVVKALIPDNVVVELCRSRAGIMYSSSSSGDDDRESSSSSEDRLKSSMFSLSGSTFFGAIGRSIRLGGQSALALRLLLAAFSSKISSASNTSFGDEFRAARRAAEEIGAQIVLGDRPIEITLERAWNSLKLDEKLRFVSSLFRGITSEATSIKGDETDATSPYQLYQQLSSSYPSLLQPLVHERDVYLAWSLKRSKAVNSSKRVVGVIGKGHLNGVVHALVSDQGNLRFHELAGKNSNNWTAATVIQSLARDTILGILLWALFELSRNSIIFLYKEGRQKGDLDI